MIVLYHGGRARLTTVFGPSFSPDEWAKIKHAAARLIAARGDSKDEKLLDTYDFELLDGTNYFGDKFSVLQAKVPVEQYTALAEIEAEAELKESFRTIAETITEIGPFVRFIVCVLDTEERMIPVSPSSPRVTSEAVDRALADAEQLISSRGPSSAVDRVHTALNGYLRAILERNQVELPENPSITAILVLKLLMRITLHIQKIS